MNILNEIALKTKERIDNKKKTISIERLIEKVKIIEKAEQSDNTNEFILKKAEQSNSTSEIHINEAKQTDNNDFPFEKALQTKEISFICEVKKASPSKGIISEDFLYLEIAKEYEMAGAAAISVLTEPFYFQGEDRYLSEIAKTVSIPILRKDFVVDDYMIYEAKILGASAILLICAILEKEQLTQYIQLAHKLGLSVLVETHDENEVEMALKAGANIIGVNNRNLKTFEVDISLSERLRPLIPKDKIFVSESGIKTSLDIKKLDKIHTNAVLIGETFMSVPNKKEKLKELRGE